MDILVVVAIILVLAAIAFPIYNTSINRVNKTKALGNMTQLGSAAGMYSSQNDGQLPAEDSKGTDTWAAASLPDNAKAWYNALPLIVGKKSVAQYAPNPQAFYSKENLLFLPAAPYPESDRRLSRPIFAIAINTKLQRKKDGPEKSVKMQQITNPSRTVLFLEQGLKGEKKAMPQQPSYDGGPKGSAKSFVARYNGMGVITFCDGHAEAVEGKGILEDNGMFKWPVQPGDIIWGKSTDDADDPN